MRAKQFGERLQRFFAANPNINVPGVTDAFAVLLKEIVTASEDADFETRTFSFADGSALRLESVDTVDTADGSALRLRLEIVDTAFLRLVWVN